MSPPYPSYRDSGLEWLPHVPAHWQVKAPKRFVVVRAGGTLIKGQCEAEPTSLLYPGFSASGQDVWLEDFDYDGPGIVLSAVGARCGKTFKADGKWGVVANTQCLFPSEGMDRNFLWYLTNLENWWERGGAAQPYVLTADTLARTWAFPPLAEQRAIAAFLDRETGKIEAAVEEQRRLIALLKEKRQAVISHAVTKGLNPDARMKPSGIDWLGDIPEHWQVGPLKRICDEITVGIVVEPSKYYVDEGVPALRSLNVRPGKILTDNLVYISESANEMLSKSKLRAGDLVAVRTGQPGTCAVIPHELDGSNCIDLIIIRRSERVLSEYLAWFLSSDTSVRQFAEGSGGAIQLHFNISTATTLKVALPPLDEQELILKFLNRETERIDNLISDAEAAIDLLLERRSALISAAVTGKIDVRDEMVQQPGEHSLEPTEASVGA